MDSNNAVPNQPDPFWPTGVMPTHLGRTEMEDNSIVASFTGITGPAWKCEKCGSYINRSPSDGRFCILCVDKESQNTALAKKVNSNWMEQSGELGLALFERQPEETDAEWRVWNTYRDYYPRKLPTWTELARECNMSVATVIKAATKWSYKVRLVAWSRFTDAGIQENRISAVKEMNQKQLSMSQRILDKLGVAIDAIDPLTLRPGEIVNLFKTATELERRITTYVDETVENESTGSKAKQVSLTKPEDMGEILQILQKTGVLEGKTLGIEQTTRFVAKEND